MWRLIFYFWLSMGLANTVLIPHAEFALDNGKLKQLQQVTHKEKLYTERNLGCDITCSQMCLVHSRINSLIQCFKFCGCQDLISDKKDTKKLPNLQDYGLKAWDVVRIDIDFPDKQGDGTKVDAYLPTGYQAQRERYSVLTQPRAQQNDSDHIYVDLPNTNSAEDIHFDISDKSGQGWEKGKVKWNSIEPNLDGEYNYEHSEDETHYEAAHTVNISGIDYEAGIRKHIKFDPNSEEFKYDDVIYDPETVVANVGKAIRNSEGKIDIEGGLRWDMTRKKQEWEKVGEIELIDTECINTCHFNCRIKDKKCFNKCIEGCSVDKDNDEDKEDKEEKAKPEQGKDVEKHEKGKVEGKHEQGKDSEKPEQVKDVEKHEKEEEKPEKEGEVSSNKESESSSEVSVSTILLKGFLVTFVGAAIYRFMQPGNQRNPKKERLLTHYQRI